MGFKKTIWVSDNEVDLWRRAEAHVKGSRGWNMSAFIMQAVEEKLDRDAPQESKSETDT